MPWLAAISLAKVVFPDCLGPRRATIGNRVIETFISPNKSNLFSMLKLLMKLPSHTGLIHDGLGRSIREVSIVHCHRAAKVLFNPPHLSRFRRLIDFNHLILLHSV